MAKLTFYNFIVLLYTLAQRSNAGEGLNQKLLVVSFDAFRRVYLESHNLPTFNKFSKLGVVSNKFQSVYPSYTMPNHWSMVTGVYPETHGIVSDAFYDPDLDEVFNRTDMSIEWWDNAEPVWQTARYQGKRTSVLMWPGSAVLFDDGAGTPNFYLPLDDQDVPFKSLIDDTVHYLSKENVDLAMIHFNEPDSTGHENGPDSSKMVAQLKRLDNYLNYLLRSLEKANLGFDKLNIIVCADHGMTTVRKRVWIGDYIDTKSIKHGVFGAVVMLYPKSGKTEEFMASLTEASKREGGLFKAYLKENLPSHYRFSNNDRIGDIVIICKPGVYISGERNSDMAGAHGYDPTASVMQPVFMAAGPAFKKAGYHAKNNFETIDIYAIITHIVGITPAVPTSLDKVSDMFAAKP